MMNRVKSDLFDYLCSRVLVSFNDMFHQRVRPDRFRYEEYMMPRKGDRTIYIGSLRDDRATIEREYTGSVRSYLTTVDSEAKRLGMAN